MSPTLALIRSAFGPKTTLYDALSTSKKASQKDLKRAYRKLALKYHPDKQARNQSNDSSKTLISIEEATAKFQAVSAAYEVLMDTKRRSVYDATGRIVEDNDDEAAHNSDSTCRNGKKDKRKPATDDQKQRRWNDFFHSVFNDIITADSKHGDADTYRGSGQEKEDVLKYYKTCKGDLKMVIRCVVHGIEEDVDRWQKDIIEPSIRRGDVEDYCGIKDARKGETKQNTGLGDLVDSDEDANDHEFKKKRTNDNKSGCSKMKRLKGSSDRIRNHKPIKTKATVLIDSDDDANDDCNSNSYRDDSLSMNRRDKMEYRVAKKRKLKAKREIEMANIMKSKSWASGDGMTTSLGQWGERNHQGVLTDAMLSNMEKKYSKSSAGGVRKKLRRKK